MIIGGFQKVTLTDYPDNLAAIIFTQGCNLKCPYCYNHILNKQEEKPEFSKDEILDFLKKRRGKLDALVITGGEPTLHKDLEEFVKNVKNIGYLIKLDTNGTFPEVIERLCKENLIDYIAMDFKAPRDKYNRLTGIDIEFGKIKKTIKNIMDSGKDYEFRTTMVPDLLTKEDILGMGKEIRGAKKWYLQKFISNIDLIDNSFKEKKPFTDKDMDEFVDLGKEYVNSCYWR